MPFALHQDILRPSGVEFAVSLNLVVPSTASSSSDVQVLGNLVVARANVLKVFEIRRQSASLRADLADPGESLAANGGDGVEGEVNMDTQGDGFVNMGELKTRTRRETASRPFETRLHLLRDHTLHGVVTGLDKIRTIASGEDGLDRLLVSFKEAKIALLEWSEPAYDLVTVSIHTYERAIQFTNADTSTYRSYLRVDPGSRCAAMSLPGDSLAILPFHQTQAELDTLDQENAFMRDAPYSPSFVLDVPREVDARIKNIIDFIFLPGFSNITLAIMYQTDLTWTGRLNERKDSTAIAIITLDYLTHNYPNISRVEGLPYDCIALLAGPALYGGIIVQTTNSVLHVDQSSRITALPLNGWAHRTSDLPSLVSLGDESKTRAAVMGLMLEGARMMLLDDRNILLVLSNGNIHVINVVVDGRMVSKLAIDEAIACASSPSVVVPVSRDHLFVGSSAGPGLLLRSLWHEIKKSGGEVPAPATQDEDIDIDEDLYGDSAYAPQLTVAGSAGGTTSDGPRSLELSLMDTLPSWGVMTDFVFSVNDDDEKPIPELVATTGIQGSSSLTRFQSRLPHRTKRKLEGINGNVGLWSLSIRREVMTNGIRTENPAKIGHSDTVVISSHATPSQAPGVTRVHEITDAGALRPLWKTSDLTLAAGEFFQRTCIALVTSGKIQLLDGDCKETHSLPETDVVSAAVSDPYILIQRRDGTCLLYAGDTTSGFLREEPVYSTTGCVLSSFFRDHTGSWKLSRGSDTSQSANGYVSNLENILSGDESTQWLALTKSDGVFEIIALPSFEVAFSSHELIDLAPVIFDSRGSTHGRATGWLETESSAEVTKLVISPIGQGVPHPHVTMLTKANILLVYEAVPVDLPSTALHHPLLPIKLVKKFSRALPVQAASSSIPRHLVPFKNLSASGDELFGVFGMGIRPFWLVATRSSTVRFHPSMHGAVYSFACTSAFGSRTDFLLHTDEGLRLEEWAPGIQIEAELPYHSIKTDRPYSAITYDVETRHLVAASVLHRDFAIFDDEAVPLWTPDDPTLALPKAVASSLELVLPSTWETIDGYEFPQYELLTCLDCVPLESNSTEAGFKNFIVASTIVDRGEDLSARGAVYVFEIVEVVSALDNVRQYKLKLRCRDEAKGPVTALCGMNGYLVSSMGQKIFVRAFDLDERLVGVAFLDVGVYVTSLRCMKNLLLIGDNSQGTWFVGFQEDPFKLVILSKGRQNSAISNADFFFGLDGQLSFVVSSEDGVLRALEYNPNHADSIRGQKLMCRTEFNAQADHHLSLTLARRKDGEEDADTGSAIVSAQSVILYGTLEGGLTQLIALTDSTFKRLSLLQGQLVRNVQHVAGLNPRANRTVRNDTISRPLTKGILDGSLLRAFTDLGARKQSEMTRQIGTSRAVVFRDLGAFSEPW